MPRLNQKLYAQRCAEHIAHAKTLCAIRDYVQAGEKIWGALSALINSRVMPERKRIDEKKNSFLNLFSAYKSKTSSNVNAQMNGLGFKTAEEIFDSIYGLHKYFYGGAEYSDSELSQIIPFLISLIEQL